MQLLYFSLVCAGLTQILVYGKIFNKIRPTQGWPGELLSCPMCTGFWSGVFLWAANNYTELFTFDYSLVTGLSLGCLGSLVSYVFAVTVDDDGIKINNN
jgi:hypothetical protein